MLSVFHYDKNVQTDTPKEKEKMWSDVKCKHYLSHCNHVKINTGTIYLAPWSCTFLTRNAKHILCFVPLTVNRWDSLGVIKTNSEYELVRLKPWLHCTVLQWQHEDHHNTSFIESFWKSNAVIRIKILQHRDHTCLLNNK